jgi:predicted kinase
VDSIEQAILGAHTGCEIGAAGYAVANAVAEANLSLGMSVVADCVNPVEESREAWRMTAKRASARIIEVEIVCSDQAEHQRRVQTRQADIPGHLLPSWDEVIQLYYEPWTRARLTVDTSCLAPLEAVDLIVGATR